MEVQALTRYARMSPKKVREVARTIQGRKAAEAVDYLMLVPRKSASCVTLIGGAGMQAQTQALRRGVTFVIATPGRLLDHMERGTSIK